MVKHKVEKTISLDDWIVMDSKKSGKTCIAENDLVVGLYPLDRKADPKTALINQVRLRLHIGLIKKMGWDIKDKLILAAHKDDLMLVRLFKVVNGYTISKESGCSSVRVWIRWTIDKIKLDYRQFHKVEYRLYKDSILFRLDGKSLHGK